MVADRNTRTLAAGGSGIAWVVPRHCASVRAVQRNRARQTTTTKEPIISNYVI